MQPACPHTFTERKEQFLLPKGLGATCTCLLAVLLVKEGPENSGQQCDQHQVQPRGSLQRRDPVYDPCRVTDNSTLGDDSFPH